MRIRSLMYMFVAAIASIALAACQGAGDEPPAKTGMTAQPAATPASTARVATANGVNGANGKNGEHVVSVAGCTVPVQFKVVEAPENNGRFDLVVAKDGRSARIVEYSGSIGNPDGPVDDLVIKGSEVKFTSSSGTRYSWRVQDCRLQSGSAAARFLGQSYNLGFEHRS